ncbi:hypothetical protein GCM10017788_67270 [Amycolatopsis acidiphila]|nr:hypothetical protein GCM10017788_67270 [Amycolatopsis acidiphila]
MAFGAVARRIAARLAAVRRDGRGSLAAASGPAKRDVASRRAARCRRVGLSALCRSARRACCRGRGSLATRRGLATRLTTVRLIAAHRGVTVRPAARYSAATRLTTAHAAARLATARLTHRTATRLLRSSTHLDHRPWISPMRA